MKKSQMSTAGLIVGSLLTILFFQNCSKVGFASDTNSAAFKSAAGRSAGDDGLINGGVVPGDDGAIGGGVEPGDDGANGKETEDENDLDQEDTSDWLYIPGGRGHVPMSSVAICPAGSKDAGQQKCPMFCYKGVDYVTDRDTARNYFAKHFDRVPNYGGGAVPGTCANPDLKLKQ